MWKIKYDHIIDAYYSRTSEIHDTKKEAMEKLKKILPIYPYVTAKLYRKKDDDWKLMETCNVKERPHKSYMLKCERM